jgi:hypothetical protein
MLQLTVLGFLKKKKKKKTADAQDPSRHSWQGPEGSLLDTTSIATDKTNDKKTLHL